MRRRRALTALLALVLAVAGTVLLTGYVRGADERAMAGAESTEVLVVTERVPSGTTVAQLAGRVETRSLPALAVVPGALSTLAESGGRVTTVDLQPGEQLLDSRLVDPASLAGADEVTVPTGLQQVSLSLERQRMLGSALAPGDTVGVLISLDEAGEDAPAQTALALQKVLVTRVGESSSPTAGGGSTDGTAADGSGSAATDAVLVTLAVDAAAAQKIVFGAEQGHVWLTRQPADATPAAIPATTRKDLNR